MLIAKFNQRRCIFLVWVAAAGVFAINGCSKKSTTFKTGTKVQGAKHPQLPPGPYQRLRWGVSGEQYDAYFSYYKVESSGQIIRTVSVVNSTTNALVQNGIPLNQEAENIYWAPFNEPPGNPNLSILRLTVNANSTACSIEYQLRDQAQRVINATGTCPPPLF